MARLERALRSTQPGGSPLKPPLAATVTCVTLIESISAGAFQPLGTRRKRQGLSGHWLGVWDVCMCNSSVRTPLYRAALCSLGTGYVQ
ncbi:unnamed protein product [Closterium sp. NIES-64]|nr:unnamed protein product [Closterium sp. NIES-64]